MTTLTISDLLSAKKSESFSTARQSVEMKDVASIILAGGEGTRLFPLTLTSCKPAIPFGGKYQLIDIPISLSIDAGCQKIFVLTQFLSSSLHQYIIKNYIQRGWVSRGIEILTAEQKPSRKSWFMGTADAVRQHIDHLLDTSVEYFLILSGDQLYNLDFVEMVQQAKKTDADLMIASLPVTEKEAHRMGILKVDHQDFITQFMEKPQDPALLAHMESSPSILSRCGVSIEGEKRHLASMGIYLFKRDALAKLLHKDTREDFGKHLIPTMMEESRVVAYLYDGYWEDIGTIEAFYQANMALTKPNSPLNLYDERSSIYSSRLDLPPAKIRCTKINNSLLCEGILIEAEELTGSILGPRTIIKTGSIIRDSYLIGNDYYTSPKIGANREREPQIGKECLIERAIIDKNVYIGDGVKLINKKNLQHFDGQGYFIRDGIIIVTREAQIPSGTII